MKSVRLLIPFAILPFLAGCASFFTLIGYSPSTKIVGSEYTDDFNTRYQFFYSDTLGNDYLQNLRRTYRLDSLTANTSDQFEKVKIILDWTSKQWKHSGSNQPAKSDAISILEEAKTGKSFRCVEYGIVCSAALNSIGIPARVLALKTRDVENVKYGAGHVAAEVFLSDYKKWVFIDGQFNAIPMLNNIPLNAIEFKKAFMEKCNDLQIVSLAGVATDKQKECYLKFVIKYIFYLDIMFDQRVGNDIKRENINGKSKLMLVPLNANKPALFQKKYPINYCEYTSSLANFYREPN